MTEPTAPTDPAAPQHAPHQAPTPAKKPRKLLIIGTITAVLLVAAAAITIPLLIANNGRAEAIPNAADKCLNPMTYRLLDNGSAIHHPGHGPDSQGSAQPQDINCLLTALGASEATITTIWQTQTTDGTRETTWDGYRAQWSYSPEDENLDLLLQQTN
ncbi:hypothetical protein [Leucobacter luti]|uniref:hypothetical protein n=1 Tax=Leucobacter luti TaxID=340320 RepID=UPI003CFD4281